MATIGFPISHKENEKRRALIPMHLEYVKNCNKLYLETGYGNVLGFSDSEYQKFGVNICSRDEVLSKDIICDPKIGDAEYLKYLKNQTIFGWVHAVQNRDITDAIINGKNTAYAWEEMYEQGRHCFWRNNEIAGEAAVCHAYLLHGIFPYDTKVAVLGRGNIARGALKALNFMGAKVTVYDRKTEQLFREELGEYDVIVNAILWDTSRKDHIIYRDDMKRMKPGSMIIDISCDRNGGIETSIPTTIDYPIYEVDGITHYVVDHTPALYYKTTSNAISAEVYKYLDYLAQGQDCHILTTCKIIERGYILDKKIISFQKRNNCVISK